MVKAIHVEPITLDPPSRLQTGEARLILAMLRRSLKDARGPHSETRKRAMTWIMDDGNEDYLSFRFACDLFGLSVTDVRKLVRRG
jgi:hypothetical protein